MSKQSNLDYHYQPKTTKTPKQQSPELPKSKKIFYIVAKSLSIITALAFLLLLISIYRFNILPAKYLTIATVVIVLLAALNIFLAFFKKHELTLKIISTVLSIIFSIVSIFGFIKITDAIGFFSSNFGNTETTSTYNLLVASESDLTENSNLTSYDIYVYRDLTLDSELVASAIDTTLNANAIFVSDLFELVTSGLSDTGRVISMNSGTYEAFLDDNDTYKDRFRIIGTFEVTITAEGSSDVDVTTTPFSIYLSGIDTRSGTLPTRSLSDVNIVAFINPSDHKILLVSIPRDYYVHLAGTPADSLPDKLTHAGSTGGIALSQATIEELLDVDINYYARVNFNFVSGLVDTIGGINIYSDVDYSFTCWTDRSCTFNPGYNYTYGQCALAFARERHAYSSGDRHRGENQEQVISLILDKVTHSTALLSNFSEILSALTGTFETSFNMNDITKFVRYQLEDMPSWTIEEQNLDGTTGAALTYSYRNQYLSVMHPDQASIDAAKAKIAEIMGTADELTENATVEVTE